VTATDEERREAAAALEAFKAAGGTARRIDPNRSNANREGEGVTAAAELPVYPGPAPTTLEEAAALMDGVGTQHGGLSPEMEAAILTLQAEVLEAGEGGAVDDQAETSPPPKARPVPEPTGEGLPVPLWGDLTMKVYPEVKGACPVEFVKADRGRIYIDNPKSPPWLSTRIQDRLVAGLASALGDEGRPREFMRRKVGEAFAVIAEQLETDEGTRKALTPAAVRRVIEETERVTIYPAADGGIYEIVISGKVLILTSAQMARKTPDGDGGFNHHWLILFPTDEIDATKNEWKAIKAHWYEIAEVREAETATEAEAGTAIASCEPGCIHRRPRPVRNVPEIVDGRFC